MNCVLCKQSKTKILEIINYQELKKIWENSVIKKINQYLPPKIFYLKECENCYIQFFEPLIEGEKCFYSNFKFCDYYKILWDHKEIAKYIIENNLSSVLDYGCGSGLFFKLLPKEIKKVGIDFNIKNQERKNLKLIRTDLLDFKTEEKFEAISCIQTLEHLKEPRRHLEKIIDLLKEKGILFLSVPNREGIHKFLENNGKPLDFPPHHLTRWSRKTFEKIEEIFGLKIIEIKEEPLNYEHFKWAVNMYIGTRYNKGFINKILRKILLLQQEKFLPIFYFHYKKEIMGHSLLGIFKKI